MRKKTHTTSKRRVSTAASSTLVVDLETEMIHFKFTLDQLVESWSEDWEGILLVG